MALIKCPECKKGVSSEAETCPHCGLRVRGTWAASAAVKKAADQRNESRGILILLVLIGIAWFFWPSDDENSPNNRSSSSSYEPSDGIQVIVRCQDAMKRLLKAPATAEFPIANTRRVVRLAKNKYSINSYVDSENSFGAKIRTNYSCIMTKLDNGYWTLDSFSVEE